MKILSEIVIGSIILAILVLFWNPTQLLMPDTINMMLILALIVGFLAFIATFWRELPEDERDAVHMQKAGRISFFVGTFILVMGLAVQASMHKIDPWLIYALAGMVLSKLLTRIFQHFRS